MSVVLLATAGGVALGLLVGMNESRRGLLGVLARGLARLIDLVQAVPAVLIGLVLVAFYGGNLPTLIAAISIVLLPIQMRLVRVEVLRVRGEAFVDAARMAGMSELGLTVRTVLPNSSRAALENVSVVFALARHPQRRARLPRRRPAAAHARVGLDDRHRSLGRRPRALVVGAVPDDRAHAVGRRGVLQPARRAAPPAPLTGPLPRFPIPAHRELRQHCRRRQHARRIPHA